MLCDWVRLVVEGPKGSGSFMAVEGIDITLKDRQGIAGLPG